jgi:Fe-S-cluster containining protein
VSKPLRLAGGVVFTCQSCGDCCRGDWLIGVDDVSHGALKDAGHGDKFKPLPLPLLSGERMTFVRAPGGACVFLSGDNRCGIHNDLGYEAKPQVCREFPYHFVETPDGITAGLSFACSAVLNHQGVPLAEQSGAVSAVAAGSARITPIPDPIVLYSGVDIDWPRYRAIEEGLLAVMGDETLPVPRTLLTGSLLVALAVSLARLEQRGSGRTLLSGLEEIAAARHRPLVDVAMGVRPPVRPSLTHLAPLYTWLEFSRAKASRFGLVAALYRNYLRFRRRAGLVPDLFSEGGSFDVAAVTSVRFDTDNPAVGGFLREYWRHVVERKTLTPTHGVFRGYHTMLTLYAFMKWMARLRAHRDRRTETRLDDVRAAVRLVEQRFVLHAQFARVFELSPVLTMLVDRQYRERGFVPRAVLS